MISLFSLCETHSITHQFVLSRKIFFEKVEVSTQSASKSKEGYDVIVASVLLDYMKCLHTDNESKSIQLRLTTLIPADIF